MGRCGRTRTRRSLPLALPRHFDLDVFTAIAEIALFVARQIDADAVDGEVDEAEALDDVDDRFRRRCHRRFGQCASGRATPLRFVAMTTGAAMRLRVARSQRG